MTSPTGVRRPVYEHPWAVRLCHWTTAVAITILTLSGLRILNAFPSFGPKIPERDLIEAVPKAITLGGWLGGALRWHFTFMWIFAAGGVLYVISQIASGHYRTVLFTPRDLPGVWPMARHYFFFGPKPTATGAYNPLQKLAYTTAILLGALSLLTGMVMYKPAQLSTVGMALRWVPRRSTRALSRDVRHPRIHSWPSGDGGFARVGQLRVDAHGMEAPSGVRAAGRTMTRRVLALTSVILVLAVGGWLAAAASGTVGAAAVSAQRSDDRGATAAGGRDQGRQAVSPARMHVRPWTDSHGISRAGHQRGLYALHALSGALA